MTRPSLEQWRLLLDYVPKEGAFYWRVTVSPRGVAGTRAGRVNSLGRAQIGYGGRLYFTHKLVWLFETGVWPDMLDHIDGNPLNNSFSNLRLTTTKLNGQNQRRPHGKNPYIGVSWHKKVKKFYACIKLDGRKINLGKFDTPEAAHAAYVQAKRQLHPAGML